MPLLMAGGSGRKGDWMRIAKVLDDLPLLAHIVDGRDRLKWLSKANLDANGAKARELLGRRPSEIWKDSAARDAELNREVRRTRKPLSHMAYGRTRTGRQIALRVTRTPLDAKHVLTIGIDATSELKAAALDLVQSGSTNAEVPSVFATEVLEGSSERQLCVTFGMTPATVRALAVILLRAG